MLPKRHFNDDDGSDKGSKRRPLFMNVARDVMRDGPLNEEAFENFFRRVVRDQLEISLPPYLRGASSSRPPFQAGRSFGARGLQLQFLNKLPSTIFTGRRVESDHGLPLLIELRDADTQNMVYSGALSSVKIEVLALSSEFASDDQDDWCAEEFNSGIQKPREGKRPLVTGEVTLNLREGVCQLNNILFTDNSSWVRSGKFRLAARVVPRSRGDEVRIREAISEAFQVKDHRGELYRKHYPPALSDEVWRLEKIAKDGTYHKRLGDHGITSVRDLLRAYVKDQAALRNCFGAVPTRTWDTIMNHVLTCRIEEHKLYTCHIGDVTFVFDSIYKFLGVMNEGQLCSLDQLPPSQKAMVETWKLQAYRNEASMVPMDASAIFSFSRPLASLAAEPFNPNLELQQRYNLPYTQQDEPLMSLEFHHSPPSTSYHFQAEGSDQLMVSLAPTVHPMQAFNPALRNSFSMEEFTSQFNAENSWPQTAHSGATDNLCRVQTSTWSPIPDWERSQGTGMCFGSSSQADISGLVPNSGAIIKKPKVCWCKLRAAIKWCVSLWARRMARPLYLTN